MHILDLQRHGSKQPPLADPEVKGNGLDDLQGFLQPQKVAALAVPQLYSTSSYTVGLKITSVTGYPVSRTSSAEVAKKNLICPSLLNNFGTKILNKSETL